MSAKRSVELKKRILVFRCDTNRSNSTIESILIYGKNGMLEYDTFEHEQNLVIQEGNKKIMITDVLIMEL